jgi:hypothetical protein
MAVKRKGGKRGLHILATSASDRLTARELMVFWVLDLDLRVSLGVFSRLVLAGRAAVKLSCTRKSDRRADQSWSGNAARTKAQSRCKRHSQSATRSAVITRRCVKERKGRLERRYCFMKANSGSPKPKDYELRWQELEAGAPYA